MDTPQAPSGANAPRSGAIPALDLTVEQADLARALRIVGRAATARAPLPALDHALLDATTGRLTLSATDLTLRMVTAIPADVAAPGCLMLPARLLGEYVAQLPPGPVRLVGDPQSGRVRVGAGRASARLAATDASSFPDVPPPDMAAALALDATALRRALAAVIPAAARDDSRPILTAVCVGLGAGGLVLAAADGFRLARVRLPAACGESRELLIPARALAEVSRLLADAEIARLIAPPDGRGAWLVAGASAVHARLIEGRFPDTTGLVPPRWRTQATVDRSAIQASLQRADLFHRDEAGNRPVALAAAAGSLHVAARSPEVGEVESEIAAELAGTPGAIVVDTRLLADLLAAADADRLALSWDGPAGALVVRGVDETKGAPDEADGDVWLVMPLHEPQLLGRPCGAGVPEAAVAAA